ncbi:MAG: tRNA (adenosine(37)-N6)-threonylcarbamoyltransferase complex ATPase subunit type 1 TsaE [Phycisphaerales bacterium]|nr:tRNA (adenosine(37)-N6)-threonylcarbamoyltransferase complex ATPase subunit type 1 TsaE [Phycisphaerales bacterium]
MIELVRESWSPEETHAIGAALGRLLRAGDVVLLEGDLGAGKTALTRGVAAGMGIGPGAVSSPTFVIVHEYAAGRGGVGLVHVDAYRLGVEDAATLGLDAVPGDTAMVVEWPERMPHGVVDEAAAARVRLEVTGEQSRRLRLMLPEAWRQRADWAGGLAPAP